MHLKTTLDGSTTPQGYIAGGKTYQGGDYMGAACTQSISPPVTSHWPTSQPVTGQPGTGQFITRQPGQSTSHRSSDSKYQSLVTSHPVTGHSEVITRHQAPVIGHLITSHWSTSHWAPVNLPGTGYQASFYGH